MDAMACMFLYYDRASGIPQTGAIVVMPTEDLESVIVGIMLEHDIWGQEDQLSQIVTNPNKYRFAGGIPQSLLN